jgi:mevalonate pyrophosphate decarboxylase
LTVAGLAAIALATVAYCGSKMAWKPAALFDVAARASVFASAAVFGLLCFVWIDGNLELLGRLLRRLTNPARSLADEFFDPF